MLAASGLHCGSLASASSSVSRFVVPASTSVTQMSLVCRPAPNAPYATRRPSGEKRGVHGRFTRISRSGWPERSTTDSVTLSVVTPDALTLTLFAGETTVGGGTVTVQRRTSDDGSTRRPPASPTASVTTATYSAARADTVRPRGSARPPPHAAAGSLESSGTASTAANAAALGNRSSGRFASAFPTPASTTGATSARP